MYLIHLNSYEISCFEEDQFLFSNLGLIPRGSASADLKPSKPCFEWPRKNSEIFSWRLKLPVAKRKNLQNTPTLLGRLGCKFLGNFFISTSDYYPLTISPYFLPDIKILILSLLTEDNFYYIFYKGVTTK